MPENTLNDAVSMSLPNCATCGAHLELDVVRGGWRCRRCEEELEVKQVVEEAKYRVLEDRVLVRVDALRTVTPGGVAIPEVYLEKSVQTSVLKGVVVAVGPGVRNVAVQVSPGERVLFSRTAGYKLPETNGLVVMRESDVLAVETK